MSNKHPEIFEKFQDFPRRIAKELASSYAEGQERKKGRKKEKPIVEEVGPAVEAPEAKTPPITKEALEQAFVRIFVLQEQMKEAAKKQDLEEFERTDLEICQIIEELPSVDELMGWPELLAIYQERMNKFTVANGGLGRLKEAKPEAPALPSEQEKLREEIAQDWEAGAREILGNLGYKAHEIETLIETMREREVDLIMEQVFGQAVEVPAEAEAVPPVEADIGSPEAPFKASWDREAYRRGGVWYYRPEGEEEYLKADKNTAASLEEDVQREQPPPAPEKKDPLEQYPPEHREGIRKLLELVNRFYKEKDRRLPEVQDPNSPFKFWEIKDLTRSMKSLKWSGPYKFRQAEKGGGWLFYTPPGSNDAYAVPADPAYFEGDIAIALVRRMFKGCEEIPRKVNFKEALAPAALRFEATETLREGKEAVEVSVFEVERRGELMIEPKV